MKMSHFAGSVNKICVAQLGARMHYAVPRVFEGAGILDRLYTDTYLGNKPLLDASIKAALSVRPSRALSKLVGRNAKDVDPRKVTSFDSLGFEYQWRLNHATSFAERMQVHADVSRKFCEKVTNKAPVGCDAIWAFNGAALELFRWAKSQDRACILEQTMAPYHIHDRLLREENQKWLGWQPDLELLDLPNPFGNREVSEWELADYIVCGSQFVVDSIAKLGGPVEKCVVIPYAVDLEAFKPKLNSGFDGGEIKVLFAGEVGLRKGVPYLLEALAQMGPDRVRARLVGRVKIPKEIQTRYEHVATFEGIVARQVMPSLFEWADILILPSVVEGSATVIYEAIASGVPVICSHNSGALPSPAVVEVDCLDPSNIVRALEAFASKDGPYAPDEQTRSRYGLDAYATNLRSLFGQVN